MDITTDLEGLLCSRGAAPFLFIGSGFSRRYLGLEDWDGLLSKFCVTGTPYNYFKSSADQNIPKAARLLAEDFHSAWWKDDAYELSREKYGDKVLNKTSPLRIEISNYLQEISKSAANTPAYNEEIQLLKKCDVDGIITTNWDCFLENNIFPSYKTYIGQNELLFSNTLNIGEIYKIHGCCTKPESLVLTDTDYNDFNERNAYLASKLITIFVEHPIIFIGHSLTDPNIRSILKSISMCVGQRNMNNLQNNLIFIDRRQPTSGPVIENAYLNYDSINIPIKVVKSADFCPIYSTIGKLERKLPARVLRFCKERVFEIVKATTPEKQISVINFEDVKDPNSVEVVFGIGVVSHFGDHGYDSIKADELFEDLVFNGKDYAPKKIIEITLQSLSSKTKFAPVYKYLRALGITSKKEYETLGINLDKILRYAPEDFSALGNREIPTKYHNCTTKYFLDSASESEISTLLPLLPNPDPDTIESYLQDNFENIMASKYKYHFRRIMAFYDFIKFGFSPEKEPNL